MFSSVCSVPRLKVMEKMLKVQIAFKSVILEAYYGF